MLPAAYKRGLLLRKRGDPAEVFRVSRDPQGIAEERHGVFRLSEVVTDRHGSRSFHENDPRDALLVVAVVGDRVQHVYSKSVRVALFHHPRYKADPMTTVHQVIRRGCTENRFRRGGRCGEPEDLPVGKGGYHRSFQSTPVSRAKIRQRPRRRLSYRTQTIAVLFDGTGIGSDFDR